MNTHSLTPAAGEAAHTQYRVGRSPFHIGGTAHASVVTLAGDELCRVKGPTVEIAVAKAGYIVRACNSHAALVESLQQMITAFSGTRANDAEFAGVDMAKARAALKSATPQPLCLVIGARPKASNRPLRRTGRKPVGQPV